MQKEKIPNAIMEKNHISNATPFTLLFKDKLSNTQMHHEHHHIIYKSIYHIYQCIEKEERRNIQVELNTKI
jgi:hypothetical protein